jgi:hypothetical protein
MSEKKSKGTNRRALIAGAVAAGAAIPLITKSANAAGASRFVVDLGGVELPERVAANLEAEIRRAVLAAVASGAPKTKFNPGQLGPGIRGIVLMPVNLPNAGGMMHQ